MDKNPKVALQRPEAFDRLRNKALSTPEGRAAYESQKLKFQANPDERYARAGKVGRLLRAARDMRDKTQSEHSKESGILQSEISRIERGAGALGPTLDTIVNYAHSLDMEVVLVLKPREVDLPKELSKFSISADSEDDSSSETFREPVLLGVF